MVWVAHRWHVGINQHRQVLNVRLMIGLVKWIFCRTVFLYINLNLWLNSSNLLKSTTTTASNVVGKCASVISGSSATDFYCLGSTAAPNDCNRPFTCWNPQSNTNLNCAPDSWGCKVGLVFRIVFNYILFYNVIYFCTFENIDRPCCFCRLLCWKRGNKYRYGALLLEKIWFKLQFESSQSYDYDFNALPSYWII